MITSGNNKSTSRAVSGLTLIISIVVIGILIILGIIAIYNIFTQERPSGEDVVDKNFAENLRSRVVKVIAEDIGISGSGCIISPNGLILTNFHLISAIAEQGGEPVSYFSQQLKVQLSTGETVRPSVVAQAGFKVDPRNEAFDMILLKIAKENLPYLEFGDSRNIEESDLVYFGGYMLDGTQFEVGSGEVSDQFSVLSMGFNVPIMQVNNIDNGGLSGGPVVDENMRILGIMNMIDAASVMQIEKTENEDGSTSISFQKNRPDIFGNMISQRTDIGYAFLVEPIYKYLKDIQAVR